MPRTKKQPAEPNRPAPPPEPPAPAGAADVLTLAEAAAYLRVTRDDILRLVREQGLPGRRVGEDWRFLKSALQDWLRCPPPTGADFWRTQLGAFKDDPHLDEMLREIYDRRGRPMTEEG